MRVVRKSDPFLILLIMSLLDNVWLRLVKGGIMMHVIGDANDLSYIC